MRKRERENPCGVCGHYHKYEEGEVCGICGHRIQVAAEKPVFHVSAFPSEILPEFLYLGSYDNASRSELLKTQGISRVLNTVPACQNLYKNSFTYHCLQDDRTLPFDDANQFLDHGPSWHKNHIRFGPLNFIEYELLCPLSSKQCERDKARVLVHCMSGKNRSPAIVIGYLMKSRGWRLAQSYQWVKDRRPAVQLTEGVHQQLQEYEKKLFGSMDSNPAMGFPSLLNPPSFSFGFAKNNDPIPAPAFSNIPTNSIFAQPSLVIPPHEFTFGSTPVKNIIDSNLTTNPPNSNGSDVTMDGS